MLKHDLLASFLDKHIKAICPNEYVSDSDNHCAHFVAHVLGHQFGVTCRIMGKARAPGANIRVQEIFPKCPAVGTWAARPTAVPQCLAFITKASNVDLARKVMSNVPQKHIGIFSGGFIWHYSNTQRKVVKQTEAEFSRHYPAPNNAMFYGTLPT